VLDVRDPAVRQVFKLMVPVALGLGLINVTAVIGTVFAAKLIDPTLAPNAIDKAFRIYMLPQGMFSVAVATILFPSLARLAARGDLDGFRDTVSRGLRQINFLLLPAAAVSIVLAEPIVRLLYERGEFEPDNTPVVAGALAAFSLGLTFNGSMLMLNRAFFSLQSPWIPTSVALANLGLNAALDAAFYRVGTWGIALSTSLVNIAGTAVLLWLLQRRLKDIDLKRTARAFVLISLASAIVAGVVYGVWAGLDRTLGHGIGAQIGAVGIALVLGTVTYLICCSVFGVHELQALRSLRRRKEPDDRVPPSVDE
jgi:putative peptidoglycan lipid II flippase